MLAELGIAQDAPTANGHEDNRVPGKKKKKEKKDKLAGGEQPKQEAEPEVVEQPAAVIEVGRLVLCRHCAVHCCCAVQVDHQHAASLSETIGADRLLACTELVCDGSLCLLLIDVACDPELHP